MARTDDYENAFKIAAAELAGKNPVEIGNLSGCEFKSDEEGSGHFILEFIGRRIRISFPDIKVDYSDSDDEVPLTEKVIILHYLNQAKGIPLQNEQVTYREVPSGEFYYSAFYKRAEAPMLSVFGADPDLLAKAAPLIGGKPVEGQGDAAAVFYALPMTPITLVIWGGDDEFEPSGKILFDKSIQHYFTTEDIAWVSGMVVYRLMRLASQVKGG